MIKSLAMKPNMPVYQDLKTGPAERMEQAVAKEAQADRGELPSADRSRSPRYYVESHITDKQPQCHIRRYGSA
jgi:hypothetical protein